MIRARDVGALAGGGLLAGLGCQVGAAGFVADLTWPLTWVLLWCGLLPLGLGLAQMGALGPLARRIEARGGAPELVVSALMTMHLALVFVAALVATAGQNREPTALYAAALPMSLVSAGSVMLLRAGGVRPVAPAVAGAACADGHEPVVPQAMAALPRYLPTAARWGVVCLLAGLAIAGFAAVNQGEVARIALILGAGLALVGSGAAFARASCLPRGAIAQLAAFMLLPTGVWAVVGSAGGKLAPLALGLSFPLVRLGVDVAARALATRR